MVKTGKPDDGQAKLVKRCLDGLKQGAEAVENGSTIVESLAPRRWLWPQPGRAS